MSTLSAIVVTRHPSERAIELLRTVRGVVDELVVAVDDRAGEGGLGALEELADTVALFEFTSSIERQWEWIASLATGDWILWLDDDELPSPALVASLRGLVEATDVTHYLLAANLDLARRRRGAQRASLGSRLQPAALPRRSGPRLVPGHSPCPGEAHRPVPPGRRAAVPRRPRPQLGAEPTGEGRAVRAPPAGSQGCRTPSERGRLPSGGPQQPPRDGGRAGRRPGSDRAVPRELLRSDRRRDHRPARCGTERRR